MPLFSRPIRSRIACGLLSLSLFVVSSCSQVNITYDMVSDDKGVLRLDIGRVISFTELEKEMTFQRQSDTALLGKLSFFSWEPPLNTYLHGKIRTKVNGIHSRPLSEFSSSLLPLSIEQSEEKSKRRRLKITYTLPAQLFEGKEDDEKIQYYVRVSLNGRIVEASEKTSGNQLIIQKTETVKELRGSTREISVIYVPEKKSGNSAEREYDRILKNSVYTPDSPVREVVPVDTAALSDTGDTGHESGTPAASLQDTRPLRTDAGSLPATVSSARDLLRILNNPLIKQKFGIKRVRALRNPPYDYLLIYLGANFYRNPLPERDRFRSFLLRSRDLISHRLGIVFIDPRGNRETL